MRNTPPPLAERVRPSRGRKDKRRWCRGKTGTEHQLAIRHHDPKWAHSKQVCGFTKFMLRRRENYWICYEQEYCTVCGKIMKYSLGQDCTKRPKET